MYFNIGDLLNLASASHSIRKIFAPIIERKFTFCIRDVEEITAYAPHKVIAKFLQLPQNQLNARILPSSVTHLTFLNTYNEHQSPLKQLTNLTHLHLGEQFEGNITNQLPPNVQSIIIEYYSSFNRPLGNLPRSLTHLALPSNYILKDELPTNITTLILGKISPENKLPESLTSLHISFSYEDFTFNLPKLTHLELGEGFVHRIDYLPSSLQSLEFTGRYSAFNQSIESYPPNLTFLRLGTLFNQSVDNLPSSLIQLHFGNEFNTPADHLPHSITHISFGIRFNHPIDLLPQALKHLWLGRHFNNPVNRLPSLTHLIFGRYAHDDDPIVTNRFSFSQSLDHLPQSLTHLSFGTIFNDDYWLHSESERELFEVQTFSSLPESLIALRLGFTYQEDTSMKLEIDYFPPNLKYLWLRECSSYPPLPPSLTHLHFHGDKPPLPNLPNLTHLFLLPKEAHPLPPLPSLRSISIGYLLDDYMIDLSGHPSIKNVVLLLRNPFKLPPAVTHLCFSHSFNQPLPKLPSTLTHITFGDSFNQPLNNIPQTVQSLIFGRSFDQMIVGFPHLSRVVLAESNTRGKGRTYPKGTVHKGYYEYVAEYHAQRFNKC